MATTQNVAALDDSLNKMILAGKILEGLEEFYAEEVVMQENVEAPTVGKAANRIREKAFVDSVEQFHGAELVSSGAGQDVSFSEWVLDISFKGGPRVKMTQVARRQWKNGKIVHERFYYNKG